MANGYDILHALLKMSNHTYNFELLISMTSKCALDLLLFQLPGSQFSFSSHS